MFSHYLVKFSNDIAFKLAVLRVETRGFENSKEFLQIRTQVKSNMLTWYVSITYDVRTPELVLCKDGTIWDK